MIGFRSLRNSPQEILQKLKLYFTALILKVNPSYPSSVVVLCANPFLELPKYIILSIRPSNLYHLCFVTTGYKTETILSQFLEQ